MSDTGVEIIHILQSSFMSQDEETTRALLSEDFRFTSPQDDHIDKAEYMARCFPSAGHFREQNLMEVVEVGDVVLSRYEYELAAGGRYRNMEAATIRDGKVSTIEVYFGGAI